MKVHFVIHEAFEAPGAYESWAQARNHKLSYSRLYDGDVLPPSGEDIDLLIVLGGPQSPATSREECPHFDAAAEQALIRACVASGKAVLGVCLGSQLIGEALGARYKHSPEKEIGSFPITLTEAGRAHPFFADFGVSLVVGHWHNDMPGLTPDARIIASSEGCPRQIVQFGDLVYGFQCHMEFTPDVVDLLIAASPAEFVVPHRFVQQPAVLRSNSYVEMNNALFGFLDSLSTAYYKKETRIT
ncbi:type 1 glutamine amidotransferase [Gluconobacter thailandicus]|uniref:Type 1 glutamine amidotransferase n=1 Tax=Gluconobacter thailandicus TaxID=257438 RepID=A0AAP9EUX3_GLUTH|nr:type 1 glutamine amidotransferase [Gluconobacter thailandicus]QEH97796.1 type 1 glutamine amidotransferase [Gluconobacter thailandicus]